MEETQIRWSEYMLYRIKKRGYDAGPDRAWPFGPLRHGGFQTVMRFLQSKCNGRLVAFTAAWGGPAARTMSIMEQIARGNRHRIYRGNTILRFLKTRRERHK